MKSNSMVRKIIMIINILSLLCFVIPGCGERNKIQDSLMLAKGFSQADKDNLISTYQLQSISGTWSDQDLASLRFALSAFTNFMGPNLLIGLIFQREDGDDIMGDYDNDNGKITLSGNILPATRWKEDRGITSVDSYIKKSLLHELAHRLHNQIPSLLSQFESDVGWGSYSGATLFRGARWSFFPNDASSYAFDLASHGFPTASREDFAEHISWHVFYKNSNYWPKKYRTALSNIITSINQSYYRK